MITEKLSDEEIQSKLSELKEWKVVAGKLHREYRFTSFIEAFGFMARAAIIAESMNHHPEWSNVYNKVNVDLMTHDVSGISSKDFHLARKMEGLIS